MKKFLGIDTTKPILHTDHARPKTRREFLSQGFLTGTGVVTLPTFAQLFAFSSSAQAACDTVDPGEITNANSGFLPFIALDLAGGSNLGGANFLVGGEGGQMDTVFTNRGWIKAAGLEAGLRPPNVPINEEFGIAMLSNSSFLAGMQARTSTAARANVDGFVTCGRSDNDTGNNPHNPAHVINQAGLMGEFVSIVGTGGSNAGARSKSSLMSPVTTVSRVQRPNDVLALIGDGALSPAQIEGLVNTAEGRAILAQANMMLKSRDPETLQAVECAFKGRIDLVKALNDTSRFDPARDQQLTQIITPDEMQQRNPYLSKTAAVSKMVFEGVSGPATIELSGYDYHVGATRGFAEGKDFEAGEVVGSIIEYAHQRQQPVMIYIYTDGGVAGSQTADNSEAGGGKFLWGGDEETTGTSVTLVYNPNGRVELTPNGAKRQIGHFRANGSVEDGAGPFGDNPIAMADLACLNWLALQNRTNAFDQFNQALGNNYEQYMMFNPII